MKRNEYAAFLRNVMVGRNGLSRQLLVACMEQSGATDVRSVLSTGNVLFTAGADADAREVVAKAAAALKASIGCGEPIFLRSCDHLRGLIDSEPFAGREEGVYERLVTFLPSTECEVIALPFRSKRGDLEMFERRAAELFSVTWMVSGRPGQPGKRLEESCEYLVTTRNWNTIVRMVRPGKTA